MTGPYTLEVELNPGPGYRPPAEPDLVLSYEDVTVAEAAVGRFYSSGGGATKLGTLRAGVFYMGALLADGEDAMLTEYGFVAGERTQVDSAYVRREGADLLTSLGSRWAHDRRFRRAALIADEVVA